MLELLESLRADQFERWQAGERVQAETYLDRNPTLRDDPEAAVDLIYSEILLREELGEAVAYDEYRTRFPGYAAALERQLQLHDLFGPELPGDQPAVNSTTAYPLPADLRIPADRLRTLAHCDNGGTAKNGGAADDPARWPVIPGFTIECRLGSGGGGVVYRARQHSLDRTVALKVLHPLELPEPEELALFRNEAEAVARLQHPNVVQIHEFGNHKGYPFCVMEYVAGGGLDKRLAGKRLPPREAAALVVTLARAVHAVHGHGIIHRDLKPGNILLDAGGVPKVADFGLAKRVGAAVSLIRSGTVAGTPAYMAPEQACGRSKEIGPATDVYSLGAILYELLAGRPPFKGESLLDTLEQVKKQPPVAPRTLDRTLPRDLELICLKCLEKEPGRRYASAEALAADLERFLRGEAPAGPESLPARLVRRVRRRPWLVAGVALLVAAVSGMSLAGYLTMPENPETALRRTLAADGTYTFVGDKGVPRHRAWPVTLGVLANPAEADEGFSYKSVDACPLQLLTAPGLEQYRFRAKVRHDQDSSCGAAGIFFGLTTTPTANGDVLCYCTLTFNDLTELPPHNPPGKGHNPVRLQVRTYRPKTGAAYSRGVGDSVLMNPAFVANKSKPFRDLAVEVSPAAARIFWEGQLVCELTQGELSEAAHNMLYLEPALAGITVRFPPAGGFGTFVDGGAASFKDVVIETLPEN